MLDRIEETVLLFHEGCGGVVVGDVGGDLHCTECKAVMAGMVTVGEANMLAAYKENRTEARSV